MRRASIFVTALIVGCSTTRPITATEPDDPAPHVDPPLANTAVIAGRLRHKRFGMGLPRARVIAECTCVHGARETLTDKDGHFQLRDLPPGRYELTMLFGDGRETLQLVVQAGRRYRLNRLIDPEFRFRGHIE